MNPLVAHRSNFVCASLLAQQLTDLPASENAVNHAFALYDPAGAIEFEDREKLILMRGYVRSAANATQVG